MSIKPPGSPAFDSIALKYDAEFTDTPVGMLQRKRVYHFTREYLQKGRRHILEINCGTGADALWMAEKDHSVVATDISGEMIACVKNKIARYGKKFSIRVMQCGFEDLGKKFAPGTFDLIFSNFGGLNCIPPEELKAVSRDLAVLLKPGGKFIAVIMGRKCLWERGYFAMKGKWKQTMRRNALKVDVELGDAVQPTWYYSPGEMLSMSREYFEMEQVRPIGIAIPPSYLNAFFKRKKVLLSLLAGLEKMMPFSFLSNYADHFFIALKKIK